MKRTATLEKYALLDLLRGLRDELLTGFVDLEARDEHVRLYLRGGDVLYARSSALRHSLPAYLLSHRAIDRKVLKDLLDAARSQKLRFEQMLVVSGAMEPTALRRAQAGLAEYVLSFAFGLCPASSTVLRTADPEGLEGFGALDLERAFFRFVATRDTPEEEASLLRDCFDAPIGRAASFEALAPKLSAAFGGASPAADPVVEAIRAGSTSVSALLGQGLDPFDVIRRTFAMHRAGMIWFRSADTGTEAWQELAAELNTPAASLEPSASSQEHPRITEGTPAQSASREPSNMAMLHDELASAAGELESEGPLDPAEAAIRQAWEAMARTTLYEVLGVPADAPVSLVRERFRALRLRYDPAAYATRPLSEETQRALRSIVERLDTALRTLTDLTRRSAYHAQIQVDGRGLRVSLNALFESESKSKDALLEMRAGKFAQAAALYREAIRLSPHDPTLRADLGWAEFQLGWTQGGIDPERRSVAMGLIDEALALDARCEAAIRVRARVARAEGRLREALEAYNRLQSLNPLSKEARRATAEIRQALNRPSVLPLVTAETVADDDVPAAPERTAEPEGSGVVHRITGLFRRR
jgi:tetratricopeptide (TPR) repeat protein